MYCANCGVKLEKGTNICPLCGCSVYNPEKIEKERNYPDHLPDRFKDDVQPFASYLLILGLCISFVIFVVCMNLYGHIAWGGYVILAILTFYITFGLPLWFYHPNYIFHIAISHLFIGGYLLYICLKNHGHWFLSFAMPIVLLSLFIMELIYILAHFTKINGFYIAGLLFLLVGGFTTLIELFEHITFATEMFVWSIYSLPACSIVGLFFILCGVIKKLGDYIKKIFFI